MAIRDLFHNDIDGVNFDHDLTQVLIVKLLAKSLHYNHRDHPPPTPNF